MLCCRMSNGDQQGFSGRPRGLEPHIESVARPGHKEVGQAFRAGTIHNMSIKEVSLFEVNAYIDH